MIFYEIEAKQTAISRDEDARDKQRKLASAISSKSDSFYRKSGENTYIFPFAFQGENLYFAAILRKEEDPARVFQSYSKLLPFAVSDPNFEEITYRALSSRLSAAVRNDFVEDIDRILGLYELQDLEHYSYDFKFGENLVSEEKSREKLTQIASRYLFRDTFLPELERIFTPSAKKNVTGHPVHYLIRTDDREGRKAICRALLNALYTAGRIRNRRYAFFDCREDERFQVEPLAALYTACEGGSVMIRLEGAFSREGKYASRGRDALKKILALAESHKNRVLTVFCCKKTGEHAKDLIFENWSACPLIEINEGILGREDAIAYLKNKAKEEKIRPDKKLCGALADEEHFSGKDLDRIFRSWYDQKLRGDVYPQYENCKTTKMEIREEKIRGSAYEKLQNMIGLSEAKSLIDKAISYFKMQKIFAERGFSGEMPSMHMIFTGNPGTAKTTVARLFAEIMKENGLLPEGHLYEVGRSELVGQYVGSTAPLVKDAFLQAKGGVLFIDEAYALVDDRDGLFGDEAINSITQEMENHRRDTVVIFAGYPDKMEGFLKKNPGLRSRIAFHLNFKDYTDEELCAITDCIAAEHGLTVDTDARGKLSAIFREALIRSDFGNGRFARNLVEQAKMALAQRLMKKDPDAITDRELRTLRAEDFEAPAEKAAPSLPVGFTA